jgi:hypothetical protein
VGTRKWRKVARKPVSLDRTVVGLSTSGCRIKCVTTEVRRAAAINECANCACIKSLGLTKVTYRNKYVDLKLCFPMSLRNQVKMASRIIQTLEQMKDTAGSFGFDTYQTSLTTRFSSAEMSISAPATQHGANCDCTSPRARGSSASRLSRRKRWSR